nr:hypothetical protein [Bacillus pinisoli]
MEKEGIPTAVVNTEPFISSSKAMAVAHGIPDYPFVIIPHPIATTEAVQLNKWAEQTIEEVVEILVTGNQLKTV